MVLYFSGTGNSRYIATRIADGLGDDLLSMNDRIKDGNTRAVQSDRRIVVVTPTYAWRIPRIVRDWIARTGFQGARQAWFVMNCGSEIGNAAKYNRLLCTKKGFAYMGTVQILMPENYIALFSTPEPERARQIISAAEPAIDSAIRQIASGQPFTAPRNKLCDRIMSGPVNAAFYPLCVKGRAVSFRQRMHRLREMRPAVSAEQHRVEGWAARLEQKLHALHGVYQLLPAGNRRVWKKQPGKATILFRKTAILNWTEPVYRPQTAKAGFHPPTGGETRPLYRPFETEIRAAALFKIEYLRHVRIEGLGLIGRILGKTRASTLPPFLRGRICGHFCHVRIVILTHVFEIAEHDVIFDKDRVIAHVAGMNHVQHTLPARRIDLLLVQPAVFANVFALQSANLTKNLLHFRLISSIVYCGALRLLKPF